MTSPVPFALAEGPPRRRPHLFRTARLNAVGWTALVAASLASAAVGAAVALLAGISWWIGAVVGLPVVLVVLLVLDRRRAWRIARDATGSVPGVTVRLEPMTREQYDAYRVTAEADYATSIRDSGSLPDTEAPAKSAEDVARLLPDGLDSEGHRFWTAYDGDDTVGLLWLRLTETSAGTSAFGYDFSVREDLRQQGYGRAIMLAAEEVCRGLGIVSISLNVLGHNHVAQSLYEQMGFRVTSIQMTREL
jgi:GNAT superfamily N-acetyltransferase